MTLDPDKTVREIDFKIYTNYDDALKGRNFHFMTVEYSTLQPPHTQIRDDKVYKLRTLKYETPKGTYTEQVYVLESMFYRGVPEIY